MVDAIIYKVKKNECPTCKCQLDAATPMDTTDERPPVEGDIHICAKCATILTYDKNMDPQVMSQDDIRELEPSLSEEIQKVQKVVQYYAGIVAAQAALTDAAKDLSL